MGSLAALRAAHIFEGPLGCLFSFNDDIKMSDLAIKLVTYHQRTLTTLIVFRGCSQCSIIISHSQRGDGERVVSCRHFLSNLY